MRILSISLGLAAVALVAAQADPLAANGPQSTYEWAGETDLEKILAFQEDALSEYTFREALLTSPQVADFQAEGCEGVVDSLVNTLNQSIADLSKLIAVIPGVNYIIEFLRKAFNQAIGIVTGAAADASITGLELAIHAITATLKVISELGYNSDVTPILTLIYTPEPILRTFINCQGQMAITVSRCDYLADLYRGALEDSAKISPALNLPADASEDVRRLTTGALTLLDLMAKTSIAKTNDALLATRPIFAADLLQEYRAELLRMSQVEDIRNYAGFSLGSIVGFSNSLEACLRVAADPLGALQEYNEEMEDEADDDEDNDDEEDNEQ